MTESISQQVNRLRKEGKLSEAWQIACPAIQENKEDRYLQGAFFWLCYGYLKELVAPINERGKQEPMRLQPSQSELQKINFRLDWLLWLDMPKGDFNEYRTLVLLFQKGMEFYPKLVLLLVKHSPSFEPDDLQPFKTERGESPSLLLTYARKIAKAWQEHKEVRSNISIDELLPILDKARSDTLDSQHKIWLDYDEAKCLIIAGREEQARDFVIPVLNRKRSESWAWGALAATYRNTDTDKAIMLFAQGILCAHDEKFSLRLLKGVSKLLVDNGYPAEASMCIKKAAQCYETNGWNIKADLQALMNQPWYDASVDTSDLTPFLTAKCEGAEELLNGPVKKAVGVVISLHKSGKGLHVYLSEGDARSVPLHLFKKGEKPALGDYVQISMPESDSDSDSIVSAQLTELVEIDGVRHIEDSIKINPKGFGFVGDAYVAPHLAQKVSDGQKVSALTVRDLDKKKNKMSWKVIKLSGVN
ncbi:hypothetical protein [Alcanivorax sp. 1008]|uniref:DUF7017 domain-containing protein n=1 Tax=Alcanivorax sp. 1008 TaxID=2816853 RepID=UPI001D5AC5E2|nr:hypothetical protein [Alcanivorax sp. 1008]MCC1497936.1 hypothetical protein [Alcanivorax sp. 1008]